MNEDRVAVEVDLSSAGTVVAVRGSGVYIRFEGVLPAIHTLLRAGEGVHVAIEVLATGQRAVIGSLDQIEGMLDGSAGTQIWPATAGGADTL